MRDKAGLVNFMRMADVYPAVQIVEIINHVGVVDRSAFEVEFQVLFRDVSAIGGAVDQDMVPRPGVVGAELRAFLLSLHLGANAKLRIDVNDHATVIEQGVMDHLTDGVFGVFVLIRLP